MAGADLPAEVPDNAYLLDVLEDGRFRFRTAGRALEERLGRPSPARSSAPASRRTTPSPRSSARPMAPPTSAA
ncbi:hypothetical protein ACFQY5_18425 [Paeniroseomonas aquatica]|uniref:hypothetical protein n=1 Tax=Paeniroseomonas aquatica TaxID=373043 RepID=UPI00361C7611